LEEKSVEKRCLDLWGEENQIYQMIEEGSELVTALCHRRRGRYNVDHVCEEIADCFAMLGQMDLVFGKIQTNFLDSNPVEKNHKASSDLLSTIGELQLALARCTQPKRENEKIKDLLHSFRYHLNCLAAVIDNDAIAKWKAIKRERILIRLELEEKEERKNE